MFCYFYNLWFLLKMYVKANHAIRESLAMYEFCYRLKATNEWQDDGEGILHQVAQFPIDQVYLIYKAPMPLSTHTRPRDKVLAAMQLSLYVPLNLPPLARRGSWNVQVVNNYQDLSEAFNKWNVIHHATSPECDSPIVWHSGTQLMLGQYWQLV